MQRNFRGQSDLHFPGDFGVELVTSISTTMEELPAHFVNVMEQMLGLDNDNNNFEIPANQESVKVALGREYLDKIPITKYKKKKRKQKEGYDGNDNDEGEEEDNCSICLGTFKRNQHIRNLPCKHIFHRRCIDKWFDENVQCPLCRADMRDITVID